jgi:hypothetical protein
MSCGGRSGNQWRPSYTRNKTLLFFAPRTRTGFGFPASAACFEYLILNHVVVTHLSTAIPASAACFEYLILNEHWAQQPRF